MSAVTQLRQITAARQLAEASGAPRPLVSAPVRSARSGGATVIPLRPAAEPEVAPGRPPASIPQQADPLLTGPLCNPDLPVKQFSVAEGSDADTTLRISGIARSVAQGALEVLGGARPLQQMARWLDPENYERLQLRTNLARCIASTPTTGQTPRVSALRQVVVRSARVCPISPGVFEASVVAFDQRRVRAVALRIEQRRGVWRVTALEIG
ncbi:Rv3235 family protein [Arthrobacter cheniae]|uniref:Rv3235 family protein n=1 Tax=Arthrobacter cheniae TaxID=1258888 RepID=UPI0011C3B77F|nr:Rv3235 family protein [Arthrobacter cheniae]